MDRPVQTRHLEIRRHARYAVLGPEGADARSDGERSGGPPSTWFVLHGYGQTAPRFLRRFFCLDDGSRRLVAPEGLHRCYTDHESGKVGASWMTSEDRLTDIADYVAYLDRLHERIVVGPDGVPEGGADAAGAPPPGRPDEQGEGHARVVGLGFSQGVHTLARWMAFGAPGLDTAVFWGSHLPPDLDLDEHAPRFRGARVLLVAGDEDPHFGAEAVAKAEGRLRAAEIPFRTIRYSGGHRLGPDVLERIGAAVREPG